MLTPGGMHQQPGGAQARPSTSNLTVTNGNGFIRLSWILGPDTNQVRVDFRHSSSTLWRFHDVNGTSFTINRGALILHPIYVQEGSILYIRLIPRRVNQDGSSLHGDTHDLSQVVTSRPPRPDIASIGLAIGGGGDVVMRWSPFVSTNPSPYNKVSYTVGHRLRFGGGQLVQVETASTSHNFGKLALDQEYVFRVRDLDDDDDGWSTVEIAKPQDSTPCPDLLHTTFDDVTLTAGEQVVLDMADYFSGDHFTYTAKVTTTNQTSGKVRTGPLNVIARNKITGTWNGDGDVLTLTAGTADPQTLTLEISAYDIFTNTTISDGFDVTLAEEQPHPPETPEVPEEPETPEQPEPPETPETAPGVPAQPSVRQTTVRSPSTGLLRAGLLTAMTWILR